MDLKFETNIVEIALAHAPASVFGSSLSASIESYGDSGWMVLSLYPDAHELTGGFVGGDAVTLRGLPTVGFMVYNVINANAQPGMLANYSALFAHHTHVYCTTQGAIQNACY